MQYRDFGKTGIKTSALGFGCMRLPKTADGAIDEAQAIPMLEYAIEHGVNYFDTAYGYHNGQSERLLGKALQNGLRQRVHLTTKLPCWAVKTADDFPRLLHEQLEKLQTDHLDFYLIHGLSQGRWTFVRDLGVLDFLDKVLADGLAKGVGFSFHDTFDVFKDIIDSYAHWSMAQIQYNYMNETYQAGTEGLRYAASKGMAVVVMEPLLGGRLVNPPQPVQHIWDMASVERSAVEWALSWLWHKPEVSVVLGGMSTMQQVQENITHAGHSSIGMLSPVELEIVSRARDVYESLMAAPCTSCAYCMPCPNGVDIPRTFSIFNSGLMYANLDDARRRYTGLPPGQDPTILADSCIQCHECEEECPQNIPISDWMPYIHEVLGLSRADDRVARPAKARS